MGEQAKVYERTENGVTSIVSVEAARAEGDHAMMAGRRDVRSMSSGYGHHVIEYKDGRKVTLKMVDAPAEEPAETDSKGRLIVTVKDKRYIVDRIISARPKTDDSPTWIPEAFANYWSERDGEIFGPTRSACASMKPGTVGRAIWDAVNQ
jgi:hypothetical protein